MNTEDDDFYLEEAEELEESIHQERESLEEQGNELFPNNNQDD